jgi:hypothetical protein
VVVVDNVTLGYLYTINAQHCIDKPQRVAIFLKENLVAFRVAIAADGAGNAQARELGAVNL